MTPKDILKLYPYLCTECRYDWVYEGSIRSCDECSNKRFNKAISFRTHVSMIEVYEDYETNTIHVSTKGFHGSKGRAMLIFGQSGPYPQESFNTFIYRVDIIFGMFLTSNRFIGTSMPRYDIFNTSVWVFAT